MSKAFGAGWTTKDLAVESLQLDSKNPRLELEPTASQDEIRQQLLATEDVFDLIHKIATSGGMLAGERIIVVKEHGKYVVLEGNRRATAAQILRNPSLISRDLQKRLPTVTPDLKQRLAQLSADIAPSRLAAEPILTKRHTERGVKPWSTLANMRRVVRYFDDGSSVDEISSILSISRARATQLLRGHRLLQLAQKAPGWTADEQNQLHDAKLVTSGFTRFFTLKDARVRMDLNFNDRMEPTSGHLQDQLQRELQRIARGFLIKDANGKTAFDTRSSADEVLEGRPRQRAAAKTGGSPAIKTPKASSFFEKIECKANDDSLIHLCKELKIVDHNAMPIAATVLLRSTLETALVYQVKKKGKWPSLISTNSGRDVTLSQLFKFCANEKNQAFNESRVSSILNNQTARDAKDYLDVVVHGRWMDADPARLHSIANSLRKVITAIVEDSQ